MYPKRYFDYFSPQIVDNLVFVGMSFRKADAFRWEDLIKPGVLDAGLEPYRIDMSIICDSILTDIMKGIMCAKLLLFDVSSNASGTRNGNVMYELGIAHAIREPEEILIIRSDSEPLLFDMATIRVHNYDLNDPGSSQKTLTSMLKNLYTGLESVKSLATEKAISNLDEVCVGFLHSHAAMEFFSLLESTEFPPTLCPSFSQSSWPVVSVRCSSRAIGRSGV